jgi:RNA polymerase sigma factor (sigma-70 family)
LTRHDEAAFEALLRRHGPMVLGVCRRVLRHPQDAEDAFQATFLVLVRKGGTLRARELLGNWLYGVAHRTAIKARAMSAKRQAKERRAGERPQPAPPAEKASEELLAELDAALARLPDRYRVPVVLCELEGRSRKEVARTLGIPEGTLSWRLANAKKLLARRLARYGAGALSAVLARDAASACVPPSLLHTTAGAALRVVAGESLVAGTIPAHVVALTEGVIKAMLLSKIKGFVAVAFVLLAGLGALGLTYRPAVAQQAGSSSARLVSNDIEELRLEVAALRKGLESTRERVKALETEVETLKVRSRGLPPVRASRPANIPETEWAPGMPGGLPPGGRRGRGQPPLPRGLSGAEVPGGTGAPNTGDRGNTPGAGAPAPREQGDTRPIDPWGHLPPRAGTPGGSWTGGTPADASKLEQREPLGEAEAALKKLRQKPDDKQAAEELEQALRQLKERQKPAAPHGNSPGAGTPGR